MLVLYINYVDMETYVSGSSVRPQKIYEAMIQLGYTVKMLFGSQNRDECQKRKERICEINKWLDDNKPDFCYIESPVYPIMLRQDRDLIRRICKSGIPTGYFYRDFYRKFPDLLPNRNGVSGFIKDTYLDYLQKKTDVLLKNCSIVYFPSELCFSLFDYKTMKALPPAGEIINSNDICNYDLKTIVYVGGVSELYGFRNLIEAFDLLNKKGNLYKLLVVCRKNEWEQVSSSLKQRVWLTVFHLSGKELASVYKKAAAGIITKPQNKYNNMAVSVKLFEYISYGVPIISTHSDATDRIINEFNIGITVNDTPEAIANGVLKLLADDEAIKYYRNNTKIALQNNCQWIHRVKQVEKDLIEINNEKSFD